MATESGGAQWIDRIRKIAFREARDAGATFISRSWIADKLNPSEGRKHIKLNRSQQNSPSNMSFHYF